MSEEKSIHVGRFITGDGFGGYQFFAKKDGIHEKDFGQCIEWKTVLNAAREFGQLNILSGDCVHFWLKSLRNPEERHNTGHEVKYYFKREPLILEKEEGAFFTHGFCMLKVCASINRFSEEIERILEVVRDAHDYLKYDYPNIKWSWEQDQREGKEYLGRWKGTI